MTRVTLELLTFEMTVPGTANVRRFRLSGAAAAWAAGGVSVDEQWFGAPVPERFCWAEAWAACGPDDDRRFPRRGAQLGPIRAVFAAPWAVVVPDEPSPVELELAVFIANGHAIAIGTSTRVVRASEAPPELNHVLLGRHAPADAWPVRFQRSRSAELQLRRNRPNCASLD